MGERTEAKEQTAVVFCYLILVNCLFIAMQELFQAAQTGFDYLTDYYNYIELTPLVSATITMLLHLREYYSHTSPEWTTTVKTAAQIVTALFLWFKFITFLRPFKAYGHLIRMIGQVFADMRFFMVILFVLIIAFSDAFYSESNSLPEDDRYIGNFFFAITFSYETALGALETDNFQGFVPWLLFFAVTIFNLIVMLNLLIAIISETFDKVTATKEQEAMLQLAQVIATCRDFPIFPRRKRAPCEYLFIAKSESTWQTGDVKAHEVYADIKQVSGTLGNI